MLFSTNASQNTFDLAQYRALLEARFSAIIIPELNESLTTLKSLANVTVEAKKITLDLLLPTFALKSEREVIFLAKSAAIDIAPSGYEVELNVFADVKPATTQSIKKAHIANVKNIILVASGKGGVGKSTVASNLAVALGQLGCSVGLLDADVYGPSIPVMFGIEKDIKITGLKSDDSTETFMLPVEKHGIRLMSIGFLVDTDQPLVWRGPMIASASMQLFYNVAWGDLDYLIVDLPPGTGDIQLSIAQKVIVAGSIIVSTPQEVALADVLRAKAMFDNVKIPCLGVVENMSYFICDGCDKRHEIFTHGGAKQAAENLSLPFLAEVPLEPSVRAAGDNGQPVVMVNRLSASSKAFVELAHHVAITLAKQALQAPDTPSISISGDAAPAKRRGLPVIN